MSGVLPEDTASLRTNASADIVLFYLTPTVGGASNMVSRNVWVSGIDGCVESNGCPVLTLETRPASVRVLPLPWEPTHSQQRSPGEV